MKKRYLAAVLALMMTMSTAALAADPFIGSARTPLTVEIEGENLDLTSKYAYIENEVVMIPVRAVGEALGYTVTWVAEYPTEVRLDNGTVKTTITIGEDLYFMASSTAIGMSKPSPLGVAPVAEHGVTYVPMDLFGLLGNGVVKKDNVISFSKEKGDNMTQIPNPMKKHETIEEAAKAANVTLGKLPNIPETFSDVTYYAVGGDMLHVIYKSGDIRMIYRQAKGDKDTSGDYTVYPEVKTATIAGLTVTTKGADGNISVATWQNGGYSYSLGSDLAVSVETLTAMLTH